MISIKEYAKSKNVSYEAIRKQISRYKNDLEGHISKVGRTQYLDDQAVSFLDKKRADNPIIVMETDKDEEIAVLQEENKRLLLKLTEVQDALLQVKDQAAIAEKQQYLLEEKENQISELQEENRELKGFNQYYEKEIDNQGNYIKGIEQENQELKNSKDDLSDELAEVKQMSVWQFVKYKKKRNT